MDNNTDILEFPQSIPDDYILPLSNGTTGKEIKSILINIDSVLLGITNDFYYFGSASNDL